MDVIQLLQEENEHLRKKINLIEQTLGMYKEALHDLITQINDVSKVVFDSHNINIREHIRIEALVNNMPFETGDPRGHGLEYFYPKIVEAKVAVQEIIDNKRSMARFGDGEFSMICGHARPKFQRVDEDLGRRLKHVLQSEVENLMIGIANNYGNLEQYTDHAANAIRIYMQNNIRREHMQLLSKDRIYYDAYLSRPYVMYRDHFTDAPKRRFNQLKEIWNARNVIMIEGAQTRLGVGNDLFDNCRTIRRILAPVVNAYDRYDDILKSALKHGEENDLFLIATGPSAGVFAYDLTLEGFQAVDIGHVDLEYEWFLRGKGDRTIIENKYTHEVIGMEEAEDIHDPLYEAQIVDRFL